MEWVISSRIRVIGVNFDQGKQNLVQVSGKFELFEFELKVKKRPYDWTVGSHPREMGLSLSKWGSSSYSGSSYHSTEMFLPRICW